MFITIKIDLYKYDVFLFFAISTTILFTNSNNCTYSFTQLVYINTIIMQLFSLIIIIFLNFFEKCYFKNVLFYLSFKHLPLKSELL